jgi:hypothetical protein
MEARTTGPPSASVGAGSLSTVLSPHCHGGSFRHVAARGRFFRSVRGAQGLKRPRENSARCPTVPCRSAFPDRFSTLSSQHKGLPATLGTAATRNPAPEARPQGSPRHRRGLPSAVRFRAPEARPISHAHVHNPVRIVFSTKDRRKVIPEESKTSGLDPVPRLRRSPSFSSRLPTALPWATLLSRLTALEPLSQSGFAWTARFRFAHLKGSAVP